MNVHDKDEMSVKGLERVIVRKLVTTTITDVLDHLNISRSWYFFFLSGQDFLH